MIPNGRIAELLEELDETKPRKFLDDTSISMGELRELLNTYREGRVPEDMLRVYQHARGMCFGQDWNKGTAASHHRRELVEAVNRIDPLPNLDAAPEPDATKKREGTDRPPQSDNPWA